MKISELLAKYKSDKVDPHTYGAAYDDLFSYFEKDKNLNILEVGIQRGGSLCAWKDYFPNAKVTGVDIEDSVLPEYRRDDIAYIFSDINDFKTDETFDIVIDDGSHWLKDVIHSVALFSRKLKVGGIMVIEDVQNAETWCPAIMEVTHRSWEYNKGYDFGVLRYNNSKEDMEDDYLLVIVRNS